MSETQRRTTTFYSWAKDRPCTSNAVYGWELRLDNSLRQRTPGTTQFGKGKTFREQFKDKNDDKFGQRKKKPCEICLIEPSSINHCDINKGYVMGYVPVKDKISSRTSTNGKRSLQSRDSTDQSEEGTHKDLCLWHSLSGTLVHCPDYSLKNSAQVY